MLSRSAKAEMAAPATLLSPWDSLTWPRRCSANGRHPRGKVSHVQFVATFTQEQNHEAKLQWRGRIMLNNMQINVASHKDLICVLRQLLKMLF